MLNLEHNQPQSLKALDISQDKPGDVEHGRPPTYPLAESEELVVGRKRRGCFRRKMCCSGHAENTGQVVTRRCKVFRAFKWLLAALVLLGLAHFFFASVTAFRTYKTIECTTITPASNEGGLQFTLPLAQRSSHVFVHSSLTGGDTHIIHDSAVANGTFQLRATFSEDAKQDEVYDGCMMQFKRGTGIALIARESSGPRAQIASLALHFHTSVTAPTVHLLGKDDKHLSDNKLRKLIRWWRKRHGKVAVETD